MSVSDHKPGVVRYFTYRLIFPGDKDEWVDQVAFVHPLQFQLKQTVWKDDKIACDALITKGEHSWYDSNHVRHLIIVEETKRQRRWGKNHGEAAGDILK